MKAKRKSFNEFRMGNRIIRPEGNTSEQTIEISNIKELYSSDIINEKVKEIANSIMSNYGSEEEIIIVCLLKGGFIFTADLVREISRKVQVEFMVVSSYGNSLESSGSIEIKQDLNIDISDKNVIIVDDIIDTGITLFEIKNYLSTQNPKKIETCCLLDKQEGRQKEFSVDYVGFICPNKFVVGYGMDAYGNHRNLPFIGHV